METLSSPATKQNGFKTTTGQYLSDTLQRQIVQWIRFALQTRHDPPLSKPLTIHLDALLKTAVEPENLVAVSFQAYRVLIEQLEAAGIPSTITPTLHIPLEMSQTLIIGPLDAETLIAQIDYNEPPSFYLTERALQTRLNNSERYDFPLRTKDFMEDAADVSVHYSAWRTWEDIENGWEYGRSIVAEFYPQAYQYLP